MVEQNETPESCNSPTGMIPVGSGGGSSDLCCRGECFCEASPPLPPPPPLKNPPLKKAFAFGADATRRRNRAAPPPLCDPPLCDEIPAGLLAFLACLVGSLPRSGVVSLLPWPAARGTRRCDRARLRNFSALGPVVDDVLEPSTCEDAADEEPWFDLPADDDGLLPVPVLALVRVLYGGEERGMLA